MDYGHLEKNICDTIHEGQVKLGFVEESIRIYYMLSSLNGLLGCEIEHPEQMEEALKEFPAFCKERLGEVQISRQGVRFCFQVSREGVCYIHASYQENTFLQELIKVLQTPGCQIEEIKETFEKKSKDMVCEKKTDEEFDYVIYYKDPSIDEFYYCFSIGEMGAYYHRFTEYDYKTVIN